MNKTEFKQRLSQLAEITDAVPRKHRDQSATQDPPITDVLYEGQLVALDRAWNPTLGIRIVSLKPRIQACELNCGQMVNRQVIHQIHSHYPRPHWKTKCVNCGSYQHPSGEGLVESDGTTVANTFTNYYRNQIREQYEKKMSNSTPR